MALPAGEPAAGQAAPIVVLSGGILPPDETRTQAVLSGDTIHRCLAAAEASPGPTAPRWSSAAAASWPTRPDRRWPRRCGRADAPLGHSPRLDPTRRSLTQYARNAACCRDCSPARGSAKSFWSPTRRACFALRGVFAVTGFASFPFLASTWRPTLPQRSINSSPIPHRPAKSRWRTTNGWGLSGTGCGDTVRAGGATRKGPRRNNLIDWVDAPESSKGVDDELAATPFEDSGRATLNCAICAGYFVAAPNAKSEQRWMTNLPVRF